MYYSAMPGSVSGSPKTRRPLRVVLRGFIEVGFIIFLFYSNLLMGEFNRAAGIGKTFAAAFNDIFTGANFKIAIMAAIAGYFISEFLRRML